MYISVTIKWGAESPTNMNGYDKFKGERIYGLYLQWYYERFLHNE